MEFLNWLFFGPAKLIAGWTYAGVAIAAALIGVQVVLMLRARRLWSMGFFREAPVFAGLLWLIFNAYELQVSAVMATETTLRIDLMVLVPILYVLTVVAAMSIITQLRTNKANSIK